MKRKLPSVLLLALVVASLFPGGNTWASGIPQSDDPAASAQAMLATMTPEERVGQLVLVSFTGVGAGLDSQIYDLIAHYHVGGVVLRAENNNFVPAPETAVGVQNLIVQLQSAEWQASQPLVDTVGQGTATLTPPADDTVQAYIPLLVAISQPGDGYPGDQILDGMTPMPSLMALGATWDPSLAGKIGEITGQELASLGFNMFFGPALDVAETSESTINNGLNAGVFGADPYWVGEFGSAYITGLHEGSQGTLLVVADHFPGRGSSDRPPGEEPATVRKSLEQLQQIELAPYFSVTGLAATPEGTADGLVVSHIRYQGFQGNIRTTTRPVSSDPQALTQILSLPPLSSWRQAGGILVSDDLGSQTVRSFYDSTGQSFSARMVARDALLAGNDLLYLGNIISTDAEDNYTSVRRVLEYFAQKYREDQAFSQRVDEAVLRILTKKYTLYPEFSIEAVLTMSDIQANTNQKQAILFDIARQSATLVSPGLQDLESILPSPPGIRDHIVFITDTRTGRQCSTCPETPMLAVDALQSAIFRLYGPQTGGLVMNGRLISYTLESLAATLPGGGGNDELTAYLRQADWVVFNLLDAPPGETHTTVLHRFMAERQDLLRGKQVIVFAFNAPYYLDSTEVSKLTAYYCMYGKTAPFIDVAARLLFRELTPDGVLPVSVPGIGYDLLSSTAPDPEQVIQISLDVLSPATPSSDTTLEPTATPNFHIGDTVGVRTGMIVDHNGHPVPDGTGVRFNITTGGDNSLIRQLETTTQDGVAVASFTIDRDGVLEVRAESEPALTSVVLQLSVVGGGLTVTIVAPTPAGGITPEPDPVGVPESNSDTPFPTGRPGVLGWFILVAVLLMAATPVYLVSRQVINLLWGIRFTLLALLGGLVVYSLFAVGIPPAKSILAGHGWVALAESLFVGILVGVASAGIWYAVSKSMKKE